MRFKRLSLLALMLCTGCINPTHLQRDYVGDRDACRSQSENQVGVYNDDDGYKQNDKDKNAALLQLFCECMKGHDWNVAGCPKPKEIAKAAPEPVPQPPTIVVVQAPPAAPVPAPAPAAVPPAQPAQPLACPVGTHSAAVYKHHKFVKNACVTTVPMSVAPDASAPATVFTPQNTNPDLEHIIDK